MSDHTAPSGKPPNLSISLDVDGSLTWAELFWFVDQARKAGVDPSDDVMFRYDDHQEFAGFECFIFPEGLASS
ncbi:hypothetical protein [Nocardioides sp. zg-1228]|uniref:hypothetical protein n=1 Tax=Nocardioides sp. zg-1228 TaxID=2763008 RepID=UPI00164322A9|nr:hypothetical protein [Nocardioides sp. zg-1228]MBC2933042.1 hypothetical protein [Nocardioides sp. zg-1228]QSF56764.1 hypothetical protein JX575_14305 [Nocardioides sp. zg-1228]